jgi:hypothetical protein
MWPPIYFSTKEYKKKIILPNPKGDFNRTKFG